MTHIPYYNYGRNSLATTCYPLVQNPFTNRSINTATGSFSVDQFARVCNLLQEGNEIDRLANFLWSLPSHGLYGALKYNQSILVAHATVAFHRGNFDELYTILKCYNFSPEYHPKLQNLWIKAHYIEEERIRGKSLDAVAKYRVRMKYGMPLTIWDGEKTTYSFKETSRKILLKSYSKNRYPSSEEKAVIAKNSQLTKIQVSNWFKNKRQRDRAKTGQTSDKMDENDS